MDKGDISFVSSVDEYRIIAYEHYQKYLKSHEQAYGILEKNEESIIEEGEDYKLFEKYFYASVHNAMIAIVFEAFTIEAFVNEYISKKISKTYRDTLDKLDVKNKILIAVKMATNKDFPKGSHSYELLDNLTCIRNKLVHSKTRIVRKSDYNLDTEEGMDRYLDNYKIEYIEIKFMNKIMATFDEFIKELSKIDNDLNESYLKPLSYIID